MYINTCIYICAYYVSMCMCTSVYMYVCLCAYVERESTPLPTSKQFPNERRGEVVTLVLHSYLSLLQTSILFFFNLSLISRLCKIASFIFHISTHTYSTTTRTHFVHLDFFCYLSFCIQCFFSFIINVFFAFVFI